MNYFITAIIIVILAIFIFSFLRIRFLADKIVHPDRETYDKVSHDIRMRIGYTDAEYLDLMGTPFEEFILKSGYGYDIYGRYFEGSKDKCIILLHREGRNLIASYKFLELYKNLGYSFIMFDQRYHGKSGGKNYTYGHFEKWDLKLVTDYAMTKLNENALIGTQGESGGAATALLNLRTDPRIGFSVSDSSFTDLLEVMRILQYQYLRTKSKKVLQAINQVIKRMAGFSLVSVSPLTEIEAMEVPVLFLHSENDVIIPNKMSKTLMGFKSGYSKLIIFKGSQHLLGFYEHRDEYENAVKDFTELMEENRKKYGRTYK